MGRDGKGSATIRRKTQRTYGRSSRTPSSHSSTTDSDWGFLSEDEPELDQQKLIGPQFFQRLFGSETKLFLCLLMFRVFNMLLVQTSYVPDEYWQSVEVAHNSAFGYGYHTWEWKVGLRGYLYPMIFAIAYKILAIFRIDYRLLVIFLPRLIQVIFAAVGDLYLYKFAFRMGGQRVAQWALFSQLCSWFTFYCCTRTLTNSTETVLTTVALYYFPWPGKNKKKQWVFVIIVALAVIIRPTAAILWIPLCAWHVWFSRTIPFKMLKLYLITGIFAFTLSSLIDKHFYGKWVFVHWNFLEFNFINDLGSFYGSHPWHWYVTQGIPAIIPSHIIIFILGYRNCKQWIPVALIAWTVFVYSLLSHKEFRFIYPVLPLVMYICGHYLASLQEESFKKPIDVLQEDVESKPSSSKKIPKAEKASKKLTAAVVFLLVTNIPLMLYTGLIHQRGTLDAVKFLSKEAFWQKTTMNVLYLMPCHSTPYYSHIHNQIPMRFLTCEPNLAKTPNYTDEAELFYQEPLKWLEAEFKENGTSLPSHIAMFNVLQPIIYAFLTNHNYKECKRMFHTQIPDGNVGSHIFVYCKVLR